MARPRQVDQIRDVVIATRVSAEEARAIDAVRGPLKRGEWLRWQAIIALKGDKT